MLQTVLGLLLDGANTTAPGRVTQVMGDPRRREACAVSVERYARSKKS